MKLKIVPTPPGAVDMVEQWIASLDENWKRPCARLREIAEAKLPSLPPSLQNAMDAFVTAADYSRIELMRDRRGQVYGTNRVNSSLHFERFSKRVKKAIDEEDTNLFDALQRTAKFLFRPPQTPNDERVLIAALTLRDLKGADPTREQVKALVNRNAEVIQEGDWSTYFKRCGLSFLKKGKPGPKPQKRKAGRRSRASN